MVNQDNFNILQHKVEVIGENFFYTYYYKGLRLMLPANKYATTPGQLAH